LPQIGFRGGTTALQEKKKPTIQVGFFLSLS